MGYCSYRMSSIKRLFRLVDNSFNIIHPIEVVENETNTIRIPYPCKSSDSCSPYSFTLEPGAYWFKLCGGNGGLDDKYLQKGYKTSDFPYAGGCSEGYLLLNHTTKFFLAIGGKGSYGKEIQNNERQKGGYNGGAHGSIQKECGGGGGATDLRAEVNDVFHRILVAGGGGGGDDLNDPEGINNLNNDGIGGPGGGLIGGGWNTTDLIPLANQTFGFAFGTGEAPLDNGSKHPYGIKKSIYKTNDVPGGGGGWFGGFCPFHWNLGAGGGSSFALTSNCEIPQTEVCEMTDQYEEIKCQHYAYYIDRKYQFLDVKLERGVWYGDGFAEIKALFVNKCSFDRKSYISSQYVYIFLLTCK